MSEHAPITTAEVKKTTREVSIKFLILAALFITAIFIFGVITHEVVYDKEEVFDQKVFTYLDANVGNGLVPVMEVLTFFGSSTFLIPAYLIIIIYFFWRRKKHLAINILVIGVTSTALMFAMKAFFRRSRPDLPLIRSIKTFSFPSGHTLSSFIFCSVLVYLVWKTHLSKTVKWLMSVFLIGLSLVIGLSRIILKVHFATDVIAGFLLGFAWVLFSFWILRKIEKSRVVV